MEQINNLLNIIKSISWQQWLDFFVAIAIFVVFVIISPLITYAVLKLFNFKKTKKEIKKMKLYKPLKSLLIVVWLYICILVLNLPAEAFLVVTKTFKILVIILGARCVANLIDPESETFIKLQDKFKFLGSGKVGNFVSKIFKTIIYVIAGFMIISEFGFNLNGIIAGLGIGSAIIALAAQDVAKNLIGGATIIMDRQFLIGDWIETAQYAGSVEDITFRSTRIRTFDNTEVTIPNGNLANTSVTNYGKMDKRRIRSHIYLDPKTSYSDVMKFVKQLEENLKRLPNVIQDSVNVSFFEIGSRGIDIYIFLFTDIIVYVDYLKVKTNVNDLILEIMQQNNIKLSESTTTLME